MSNIRLSIIGFVAICAMVAGTGQGFAASPGGLVAHRAVYDIDLVATHGGSQIINIRGTMSYEWRATCEAWVTDHGFELFYEYADSPGMRINSDFSTYESFDGKDFSFTSRRLRDGEVYQEIRGSAQTGGGESGKGKATHTMPEGIAYDLLPGTLFPMGHTVNLIKHARAGDKFYLAQVFDGSDEEGPIQINTFIGAKAKPPAAEYPKNVNATLLKGVAWNMRMAIFPGDLQEEESDYEMALVFHDNGIISDMLIEYDDFSVSQKLISLEKLPQSGCPPENATPAKPKR
jgi:hypothetical protein